MTNQSDSVASPEQPRPTEVNRGFAEWLADPVILRVLLAAATLALYWPVTGFDFINFDDQDYFTQNPHVKGGLGWDGFVWAFGSTQTGNWHPLTWLSLMLDATLFGGSSAGGPHFTNLVFHTANTVLLFLFLRRLTGATWLSALVAGLFAWHPLNVESVAWVSERKNVLSTFFWLLAAFTYTRYAQQAEIGPPTSGFRLPASGYYWLAFALFALGLMSKPMVVTLPFALLLLDCWPLGRWRVDAQGWRVQRPRLVLEKAPFFLLTVVMSVVTFVVQQQGKAVQSAADYPLGPRIENAFISYWRYLGKAFWPENLAVFYPYAAHRPLAMVGLAAMFLGLACFAAVRLGRRFPFLFMGWFWFLGTLVPVIGLVQVGRQSMADRYAYVPLIGVFIIVSWGASAIAARLKLPKMAMAVAAGLVLVAGGVCTRHQLGYWKNDSTLFQHALAVTPDDNFLTCMARTKIGSYLHHKGLLNEAIDHYRAVLKINPDYISAHVKLGIALEGVGQLDEAVNEYNRAIRVNPENYAPRFNLGCVLARLGRRDEAIEQFKQVLRLSPGSGLAEQQLQALGVFPPY